MIRNDAIAEVRATVDLVDLVAQTVKLKPSGKRLVGRCPFHDDNNPSLVIWPEDGRARCFGCGWWGDAIGFLMERDGLVFREALASLASRVGIDLEGQQQLANARPRPRFRIHTIDPAPDWTAEADRGFDVTPTFRTGQLATKLKVSEESLERLRVFWSARLQAWCTPMLDDRGVVTGYRTRHLDGAMRAKKDGRDGVFLPSHLRSQLPIQDLGGLDVVQPILLPEGMSDTLAALDLGFDVIGRPSCTGASRIISKLVRGLDVVVVADDDKPGQDGATQLAKQLTLCCPTVRMVTPPEKDLREWLLAGATHEDLVQLIAAAPRFVLEVA